MNNDEKFEKLSMYRITLIRHNDKWKHRRLGLNRESESKYVWIVERPTIEQCLDETIAYISSLTPEEFLKTLE